MAKAKTAAERRQLIDEARVLYEAGATTETIATSACVSPSTIRRWARKAKAAGAPWQRQASTPPRRSQASVPPAAARPDTPATAGDLRTLLEQRLADLVQRSIQEPDKPGAEDRMLKVCKVLEFLRGADDLEARLRGMKDFAGFCVQTLTEDEMPPVRKAIHMFLDKLKRENS
jgi:hypothetical protein